MEAFVKNLAQALKSLETGEPRKALEYIAHLKELGRKLSVPALGEVLLLEACTQGLVGEKDKADRIFEECLKSFNVNDVPEHHVRASLFHCRYLIKTGRMNEAEKRLAAVWDIPCSSADPFLSLFFTYCRAELRYMQIKAGRTVLGEKLIDELSHLYDSILVLECMGMAQHIQSIAGDDPGEVLLDFYYQTNKHDKTLSMMQKLKHRQMLAEYVAKGGKLNNFDKITTDKLDNSFGFLSAFIDGYSKLQFLIYPFLDEFRENYHLLEGEEAKSFSKIKSLFSEMGMIRTLPSDFNKKIEMAREEIFTMQDSFKKEVEALSFMNPVGIHFLPGFDIPVKMVQATLKDKTAVVEYYLGKKAVYCALITATETVLYKISSTQDEIVSVINKLMSAASVEEKAPKPSRKTLSDIEGILKELFRILIKPLGVELAGKDKLYIVPHSFLYDVPFHALMDEKSSMSDNFEISLLPDMIYLLKYANNSDIMLNRRRGKPSASGETVEITEINPVAVSRADEIVLMDRNFLTKPGDLGKVCSSYFLKGVGIVVGVLWDLPESSRDDFFGTFLENLISKSALNAFESAKRLMMRKYSNNPSYWAAFQLLGENLTIEPDCLLARGTLKGIKAVKLIKPTGKLLAMPLIQDGVLYTGGDDGNIIAINASDGTILWKVKTMDWVNNPFVISDGILFAGGMDKRVFAIDAVTGRRKWEAKTGGWIVDTPAIGENRVFALCKDGYLYFLKKDTGEFDKRHFVGDINKAFLTLSGDTLIATVENRDRIKVTCFDAKRFNMIWEKSVAGKLFGAARTYKGFYFHTYGKGLLCSENVFNGRIQWEYDMGSGILDLVFGDANLAYISRDNIQLLAVNLETGKTAWSVQTHAQMISKICVHNNLVYVLCNDNRIYTYDAGTGVEKTQIHVGGITGEKIVVSGNSIYIINSGGGIYLITEYPDEAVPVDTKKAYDELAQTAGVFSPSPLSCLDKVVVDKSALQNAENSASQVWTKETDEVILCEPVLVKGSALLLKSGNRMQLFDIKKSSPLWETTFQDVVNQPPAFHQGIILCGGRSGYFYSVDASNGKLLSGQKLATNFCSPPSAGKSSIFMGSTDKHLYSISYYRGKVLWKFRTGGDVVAKPAVYRNTVIFTSGDGNVYCLETEFGDLVWQARTVSPQTWDPVIEKDRVVIAGYDSYIYCFDPRNGKMFWKYHIADDEPAGKPLVTGDLVIVSTKKGGVYIIGLSRGNLIQTVQLNEPVMISPIESGNEFTLGTTRGTIVFMDKQDGHITRTMSLENPIFFTYLVGEKGMLVVEGNRSISLIQFPAKDAPATEKIKSDRIEEPPPEPVTESEAARLAATGNRPLSRDPNARFNQDGFKPTNREFGSTWMKDPRFRTGQSVPIPDDDDEYKPFKYIMLIGFFLLNIVLIVIKEYTLLYFTVPAFLLIAIFMIISAVQSENRQMKSLFHRFVPSHLLEGFMKGGKTEEKVITVLFQDIYDYTPMSESITNEELYALLQKIDAITDQVVTKNHGEIMSYIGDAYMITFNAVQNVKDHSSRAVLTAMEIKTEVEKLAKHVNINTNLPVPFKLKMGFGIHTGTALVGIRGGKSKLEPFVLGDTANIAARLQSLTRELGSDIIISENTKIQVSGAISTKSLGKSRLKGKAHPVEIFEVMGIKTASAAI